MKHRRLGNLASDSFRKDLENNVSAREEDQQVPEDSRTSIKQPCPRILLLFFSLIFFSILAFPLFQLSFEPFPRRGVTGLNAPNSAPSPSVASFLKGKFQKRAEEWFLKRHGLWGSLVRAGNELTYRLFDQVSTNYSSTILVGKEKQLFQPMYLNTYNRTNSPSAAQVEERIKSIKRLQDILAERGIPLVLLVSTNLLSLYPELIPQAFTDPTRFSRKNSYEIGRPLFDRYNLNYLDGHQLLTELKPDYPFRFFPNSGSHWNSIAACRVTKALTEKLELQLKEPLPKFACEPVSMEPGPRTHDRDLLNIANLFFPTRTFEPVPYHPLPDLKTQAKTRNLRMLFVGTSFSFSVLAQLKHHGVSDNYKLYFYYKHAQNSAGQVAGLIKSRIRWKDDTLKNDVIVLETNVAGVGIAGFDFVEDFLEYLDKEKS